MIDQTPNSAATPRVSCSLQDGGLIVSVGELLLTEEQWFDAHAQVEAFMRPVWDRRLSHARAMEAAALDAELRRWQRTETICGHEFRIQQHPSCNPHHDTSAWLASHREEDAPFVIRVDDVGSKRPWTIEGRWQKHYWGRMSRAVLRSERGGLIRFASIQAAVKKALDLKMHKKPAGQEGPS